MNASVSQAIAVSVVALASVGGIASGVPTVWCPLNLLGVIPVMLAASVLGIPTAIVVPPIVFAGTFAWWSRHGWSGRANLPARSLALAGIAVVLSIANLVFGRDYGLEYQGARYVEIVSIVSVAWWMLLAVLAILAIRRPSVQLNRSFHLALFCWLGWYALPYLGELP